MKEKKKKEVSLRLFGHIGGRGLSGDMFAEKLIKLGETAEVINLYINSGGGDVIQGYSIVSAMLETKAKVIVTVVGVAASMAAVIAVCGSEVYMNDYSKIMIHNPYFENMPTEDAVKMDPKKREALRNIAESLVTILSRRGKSEKEIRELMDKETWFSADEALKAGFIDGVSSTKRMADLKDLPTDELLLLITNEYVSNQDRTLDGLKNDIARMLGLDNPTELELFQEINVFIAKTKGLMNNSVEEELNSAIKAGLIVDREYDSLLEMGNTSPSVLSGYLKRIKDEQQERQREKVEQYFRDDQRLRSLNLEKQNKLKAFAELQFDVFSDLMEALPEGRLSQVIKNLRNTQDPDPQNLKTLDDYRKYAPHLLRKDPALFDRLLEREERKNKSY